MKLNCYYLDLTNVKKLNKMEFMKKLKRSETKFFLWKIKHVVARRSTGTVKKSRWMSISERVVEK